MSKRTGYLTIFSSDRTEIYGEFADAQWTSEKTDGGDNQVFTGTPSEGTLQTFLQLDKDAISHVDFDFQEDGQTFSGAAELLAPIADAGANLPQIRIETGEMPIAMAGVK